MESAQIRKDLHEFINRADERILNLLFAMAQAEMKESDYTLSAPHEKLLDERIAAHESNPTSGSSWDDVKSRITKKL